MSPDAKLENAAELLRRGDPRSAAALYQEVLSAHPQHSGASHMLGLLALQAGEPARALPLIATCVEREPANAVARCNLGTTFITLNRHAEAAAQLERAVDLQPHYASALLNLGICCIHLDRCEAAELYLSRALLASPGLLAAFFNRAAARARLGRLADALADYEIVLQAQPGFVEAEIRRADVLVALRRWDDALAAYDRALALRDGDVPALHGRGTSLMRLGRFAEALSTLQRAVGLSPASAPLQRDLALALGHVQRLDAALAGVDLALAAAPDDADAHSIRAWILTQANRHTEAESAALRALALRPGFAEAWTVLGVIRKVLGSPQTALPCFDRALEHEPKHVEARANRAVVLLELGRIGEAATMLESVAIDAPGEKHVLGHWFEARRRGYDWQGDAELRARVLEALGEGREVIQPLMLLAASDSPNVQKACAVRHSRRHVQAAAEAGPQTRFVPPPEDRPLRVAYVSGDFREHPVSYLMAGTLESHDRARVQVHAVTLRAADDSPMERRVRAAADHWLDVSALGDAEATRAVRDLGIDVAVDLSGHTGASRLGLFARRLAPVQVTYLGYPGTVGLEAMDYLLADDFVVPEESRGDYQECIAYLPHCFQANDARRPIGPRPQRAQFGLPEQALVLCSFNNSYKLNPTFFDIWLRTLAAVPETVLWMLAENERAREHLRDRGRALGISPERLIFASRIAYPDHLARLGLADLFLDSLPFNAGTTASDALWAGLPILTCAGASYASRMGGSLVRTIGLPELITYDPAGYEALLLSLAQDRTRLSDLRARLADNRASSPLFDCERFTRDLESAYFAMTARFRAGLPPATIHVR